MNAKWIADHFQTLQYGLLGLFILIGWMSWKSNKQEASRFKVREADRPKPNQTRPSPFNEKPKPPPLNLPGIALNGAPHEVLGIAESASAEEIQRAYKDAMKRYHPDRIQNVAPDQLKFYQDAATQINSAKEKMLSRFSKN